MKYLIILLLTSCGTTVVIDCPDAGLQDATLPIPVGITGRGACSWIGGIYQRRTLEGTLDPRSCPQLDCPFPFDRTGREEIVCDPIDVEACAWVLESVNTCDGYRVAIAGCIAESCR